MSKIDLLLKIVGSKILKFLKEVVKLDFTKLNLQGQISTTNKKFLRHTGTVFIRMSRINDLKIYTNIYFKIAKHSNHLF